MRRALPEFGARRTLDVWRGLRPCTPDGLPVIGRVPGVENAILATGHGMWGLQLAPLTGRVVKVNFPLANSPEYVNQEPYDGGWMIQIELSSPEEAKKLVDWILGLS